MLLSSELLCCYNGTSCGVFITAQDIESSKNLSNVIKSEFPTNLLAFTKENLNGKLHFRNLGN